MKTHCEFAAAFMLLNDVLWQLALTVGWSGQATPPKATSPYFSTATWPFSGLKFTSLDISIRWAADCLTGLASACYVCVPVVAFVEKRGVNFLVSFYCRNANGNFDN